MTPFPRAICPTGCGTFVVGTQQNDFGQGGNRRREGLVRSSSDPVRVVPQCSAEHDDESLDGAHGCGALAAPDSELAQQTAKDPYNFEFLGLQAK